MDSLIKITLPKSAGTVQITTAEKAIIVRIAISIQIPVGTVSIVIDCCWFSVSAWEKDIRAILETLVNQGSFKADAVFFDGYKLTMASDEDVRKIKDFAKKMDIEVWFCVSPARPNVEFTEYGVPVTMDPYLDKIDVLIGLHYNDEKSRVIMTVVKDHGKNIPHPAGVALDPNTMLISE